MVFNWFLFFLFTIRLNDKSTRKTRTKTDRFAAFQLTIDRFVKNIHKNYLLGEQITIDDILIVYKVPVALYSKYSKQNGYV